MPIKSSRWRIKINCHIMHPYDDKKERERERQKEIIGFKKTFK